MAVENYEDYLSNLPPHWKRLQLQEISEIYSGGTPSRVTPSFWNGTIPWVTPGELTTLATKRIDFTQEKITEPGLSNSSAHLLPEGAILVTTRATIGSVVVAAMPLATNQGFKSLVLKQDVNVDFYYHLLKFITPEFIRRASGSTFLEIPGREFEKIVVPIPPLPEQRRIAEILDAADDAIRQTEHVIAKLRQVKAGQLHDLLTRGLDAQGRLRDLDAHPEQFKDSPLGRIPREWEVSTLQDVLTELYRYPTYYKIQYQENGIPEVRGELILDSGEVEPQKGAYRYISEQTAANFPKVRLEAGDFVMSVRGTLGKIAVIPSWLAGAVITANLIRLQFSLTRVFVQWMKHFLLSEAFQARLELKTSATTIKTIQAPALGCITLTLPSVPEQSRIAATLDAADSRIRAEEATLAKLRQIKRGLMDDLLTGRVRVA